MAPMKRDNLAETDSSHELEQGNAALRAGNYAEALALYEYVLKKTPELSDFIQFNLEFARQKLVAVGGTNVALKPESTIPVKMISLYEGRLEKSQHDLLQGWAVNTRAQSDLFEMTIFVDDMLFTTTKNTLVRADLKRVGKSMGKGGFRVVLPPALMSTQPQNVKICFPDGTVLAEYTLPETQRTAPSDLVLLPVEEQVSVIVPIFNAIDDVKVCIERLRLYTSDNVDIILINDASTDASVAPLLAEAAKFPNFRVFHNEINLGFTRTVNRGIELAGANDVILLNSDARVTPRWIQGFRRALATDHKIATVTAMSDRAGAFSAPNIGNENDLPAGIKEDDYAVAFRRRSVGTYPTVPTGNGFCMYIRRSCINAIGGLDAEAFPRGYGEENDFCMRARSAGWRNVIDDRTYVFHDRSKSFGSQKDELVKAGRAVIERRYPDYTKAIQVFRQSLLISLARCKAGLAVLDCKHGLLPRGLFVISTLTGGTPKTNRDLMLALADRVEGWLLHCDSKVMSLYRVFKDKPDELIRRHTLNEHVEALTHSSAEYDRVMANWLGEYDFEFVHIRHIAWHSLSLPELAKKAGAKVIKSFHDFYTLCPTVKLLDGDNKYCGGTCSDPAGKPCILELWERDSLPTLKNLWVNTWREKFRVALRYCDEFITTHESVRETITEYLDIPSTNFHVIPHGRDFDKLYQLATPYKQGDALKILVPGSVATPKGSMIIKQLLKLDKERKLEFHILGKSNLDLKSPQLIVHGEYQRDDFAAHVQKIRPHVGAVFSIWNETWCHTLTEMWSVGLPVISFQYPTIRDRIIASGAGWCFSDENVAKLYQEISKIMVTSTIEEKVQSCIRYQKDMPGFGLKQMADSYYYHYNINK